VRTIARSRISLPEPVRDRRYGRARWRKVRLAVLNRDNWTCRIVLTCQERATVADHIVPATPDMPDALFHDPRNLRAGCHYHNTERGRAAKFERDSAG
jgi:hypothetical protein